MSSYLDKQIISHSQRCLEKINKKGSCNRVFNILYIWQGDFNNKSANKEIFGQCSVQFLTKLVKYMFYMYWQENDIFHLMQQSECCQEHEYMVQFLSWKNTTPNNVTKIWANWVEATFKNTPRLQKKNVILKAVKHFTDCVFRVTCFGSCCICGYFFS